MKFNSLKKRMAALEEETKPKLIASLADFAIWYSNGCKEEVEFTPAMKEAFPLASRGR